VFDIVAYNYYMKYDIKHKVSKKILGTVEAEGKNDAVQVYLQTQLEHLLTKGHDYDVLLNLIRTIEKSIIAVTSANAEVTLQKTQNQGDDLSYKNFVDKAELGIRNPVSRIPAV